MIVPFMFGVEENSIHYLWIFYKYMDFCLKNNYPIISQEEYFEKPSSFKKNRHSVFENIENGYNTFYEFTEPTDEKMKILKKYSITKDEQSTIFNKYKNKYEASTDLMKNRNQTFEKIIQKNIDSIEEKEKKKIKAFLTWIWFPSLEYIAKKNNIQVIVQEQSTYRKPDYNCFFGYFTFHNKYVSTPIKKGYNEFLNSTNDLSFFSRKELLSLLLAEQNLHYINEMDLPNEFEFGIDLGMDKDAYFSAFSKYKHNDLIDKCLKLVNKENIIGRTHPMRPSKNRCDIMDNSKNSIEWILRCKRIVTTVSNTGFETMLFNRSSYILGDNMPFCCGAVDSLDYLDDKIASIKFLNYITFCYFTPFSLMFDNDYILWRLENPADHDIFNYNMDYILKKYNLSSKIFKMNSDDRMKEILKKVHGFSEEDAQLFIKNNEYRKYEKLKNLNKILEDENRKIKNSKGWKILEKLRKIKNLGR